MSTPSDTTNPDSAAYIPQPDSKPEPMKLARKAIAKVLQRCGEVPALAYHMGDFTETRELLLEAINHIDGTPYSTASEAAFPLAKPQNPARCPFCGCDDVREVGGPGDDHPMGAVKCCNCGATGPRRESRTAAMDAWNSRRYC